ncbi:MAG: hypothetical protein ACR2M2_06095 [Gaiellaceae bacterium]
MQRVPDDGDASLDDRVGALATWLGEIAERVRTTELATGDEKTAKELRRAIEALAKHDPKLESRLTDRIDVLADRLGTLASAVSTTSAALARRDGELAALRRGLDQGNARIQTLGDELGRAASAAEIAVLSKTIATLSADRPTRKDGEQTDRLAGKVDYLTERVDTLAKTVAATAAGLAGRDGELATLRRRLDEREKHFEQAFVELRQRRGEITLDGRLDILERTLETVAESLPLLESEIGAVRARIDEASRQVGSTVTELQQSTANIAAHVAAAEARSHASEKALEKHAASLSGTVGDLAARFDSVVAGVESSLAGLAAELVDRQGTADRMRDDIVARVVSLETDRHGLTTEEAERGRGGVADLLAEVERDRSAVATRLDAVERGHRELATESASRVGAIAAKLDEIGARDSAEKLDAQFAERLRNVEREAVAAVSEIARVSASWASEFDALATRLDEVAVVAQDARTRDDSAHPDSAELLSELSTRLDAVVHEREVVAAQIALASEHEVAELRALIDGLRTRFAPNEQGYIGSPHAGGLLDALASRLESVENVGPEPGPLSSSGDGRLRLELRALELRAERAEKEEQQNRDAVLAQLARMAEQLESRFHKLESDAANSSQSDVADQAEVVQLRGAEA